MKRFLFSQLPASFFMHCSASSFHPQSCLEIEDPEDLQSPLLQIKIRVLGSSVPQGPSYVTIAKLSKKLNVNLHMNYSKVVLGPSTRGNWDIRSWNGSSFYIEGHNITAGGVRCILDRNSEVWIGRDCMFSEDVLIQCGSQHALICLDSKRQLNVHSSKIIIEDHCWLGRRSTLVASSRLVSVGKGSIIGLNSTLTRSIGRASMAVGSPARVVKDNVSWSNHFQCSQQEIERVCKMF